MLQRLSQLEYRELGDEKRRHQKGVRKYLDKVDRSRNESASEALCASDLDLILTWPTIAYGIHQSLSLNIS